ncbi:hypothetical protein W911_04250 [Hyphomicrobium nitrativorans NL23]|uniref:Uncharacterized protein n=1 Tax=Hyphomicrobium nitrativorans NL23 TaxID=1029756 RepID=V5SJ05_9HYPH|nr:hypothetical protein [Hyphomicrobium nitrativorans]AHB49924.1 hypothetical protein W911_04250 [Hyphomicrobium nitrativorans NL23]
MTSERSKKAADKAIRKKDATTPESATSLELERLDDDAVEKAVTVDHGTGPTTILPCPPISPKMERRLRGDMVTEDSKPRLKKQRKKTSPG